MFYAAKTPLGHEGLKRISLRNDLTKSVGCNYSYIFVMGVPAGNVLKLGDSFFRAISSVNILTTPFRKGGDFNPLNQERKRIESLRLDTFY